MISAILCAAGSGSRAGFSGNKILREINGLPVLVCSVSAFAAVADEIIIACRGEDRARIDALLSPFPNARTVLGGGTRTQSVYSALQAAQGDIVLVHDAARPFVTRKIIEDCITCVREFGSGVCALPATDTTVLAKDGCIASVPARRDVFTVQTPQGFWRADLQRAYEAAFAAGREAEFTDDSGVYAAYIAPPRLFLGDRVNKKLTYPEDFAPAERAGFGVDTHAFGEGDHIVLGGVRIPHTRGLVAHSDGDVLVHALMDALLSAAGLRDIGHYFPDTDARFAGADSMALLAEVVQLVKEQGLAPKNVSLTILAQRPRLAPHIEAMRANLAAALSLPLDAVGIAAGTNEHLGYVGEEKGITCFAMVLLFTNFLTQRRNSVI